jgi:predicted short-subunit dehydrogenase-like oxidoreductase (DUF2520 family)
MDKLPPRTLRAEARTLDGIAIVGAGRLGTALAAALAAAGIDAEGPLGRDEPVTSASAAVLLCVPDAEILGAAAALAPGRLVGHCSAATTLAALGAQDALTGPIARGDEETVARQRQAVAERAPEDLALFDALADATRRLAAGRMVAA